jgi:hypothetical protein
MDLGEGRRLEDAHDAQADELQRRQERGHRLGPVLHRSQELQERQGLLLVQARQELLHLLAHGETQVADLHGRRVRELVALGDVAEPLDQVEERDLHRDVLSGLRQLHLGPRPQPRAQGIDFVEGLGHPLEALVLE